MGNEPKAYSRVVACIEALFESVPQLAGQTYGFVRTCGSVLFACAAVEGERRCGSIHAVIFGLSAATSMACILKGVVTFVRYRHDILEILGVGSGPFYTLLGKLGLSRREFERATTLDCAGKNLTPNDSVVLGTKLCQTKITTLKCAAAPSACLLLCQRR